MSTIHPPENRSATPVRFEPSGLATGVGSLPHRSPEEAVDLILRHLPEIPFWPQLPRRSPLESMTLQYLEGFPAPEGRVPPAEGAAEALEAFYRHALADDPEPFAISAERAPGLYVLEERLVQARPATLRYVKGHVTGPVTLCSSLKDPKGREVLHDEGFREAVAWLVAWKTRWQVRRLTRFGVPVIVFLDEPVMEVYGSAYSSLSRELVLALWGPSVEAAESEGALLGIHCCGNTDWGLLFESGARIVNFDAYHFLDRMLLYPEQAAGFLGRGGAIAWGIVPTTDQAWSVDAGALLGKLEEGMEGFVRAGVDEGLLRRGCLLTPSCGMGSLDEDLARRILGLLQEVSARFRGVRGG